MTPPFQWCLLGGSFKLFGGMASMVGVTHIEKGLLGVTMGLLGGGSIWVIGE